MQVRRPIVAGQFYPSQRDSCIAEINQCLDERTLSVSLPQTIVGGIVPHAGWTFSGSLAALVFSAIWERHKDVHTFVVFGAAHGYFGEMPAVCPSGTWATPLGEIAVDAELAEAVLADGCAISNPEAHAPEHSIEVQLPFIQYLFKGAKILPILVPPREQAVGLGESVGRIVEQTDEKRIVCVGSTDLTHYGPRYGFTPMGVGREALKWAEAVNDRKFIDAALKMDAQGLLTTAAENCNACGAGAAAATVAAAGKLGRTAGVLLAHTSSNEVMLKKMGTTSLDSVGYAAIVY